MLLIWLTALVVILPFAQSQGELCAKSWSKFNNLCYKAYTYPKNRVGYAEAQNRCKAVGGYLAQPHNYSELSFIHGLAVKTGTGTKAVVIGVWKDKQGVWQYGYGRSGGSKGKNPYLKWCAPPNNWKNKDYIAIINLHAKKSLQPCYLDAFSDGVYGEQKGYSTYVCETLPGACVDKNAEAIWGKCKCKKDFIDITDTDVPERLNYAPGEKCVPQYPCIPIQHSLTVVFLIDSSLSIKKENWDSLVEFLRMGADQLPNSANVGFIKFSDTVTYSKMLNGGWTKKEFRDFVPTVYDEAGTNTPAALDEARKMLANDKREKKVVVLITDGMPYIPGVGNKTEALRLTKEAADKLHQTNIPLVALGFGPALKEEEKYLREWLQEEDDYFAYDKLACDLKTSHMSILMQKVCRRFL